MRLMIGKNDIVLNQATLQSIVTEWLNSDTVSQQRLVAIFQDYDEDGTEFRFSVEPSKETPTANNKPKST